MKKVAVSIMALVLILSLLALPGCAKEGEVLLDIIDEVTEDVVGSCSLYTAGEEIVIQVDIDTEPNLVDFDIVAIMNYGPPAEHVPGQPNAFAYFADVLNTDANGEGTATVRADISDAQGSVWVTVHVRSAQSAANVSTTPDSIDAETGMPTGFVGPEYGSFPSRVEVLLN